MCLMIEGNLYLFSQKQRFKHFSLLHEVILVTDPTLIDLMAYHMWRDCKPSNSREANET